MIDDGKTIKIHETKVSRAEAWQPTNSLRWNSHVLEQLWVELVNGAKEWRKVPSVGGLDNAK